MKKYERLNDVMNGKMLKTYKMLGFNRHIQDLRV